MLTPKPHDIVYLLTKTTESDIVVTVSARDSHPLKEKLEQQIKEMLPKIAQEIREVTGGVVEVVVTATVMMIEVSGASEHTADAIHDIMKSRAGKTEWVSPYFR